MKVVVRCIVDDVLLAGWRIALVLAIVTTGFKGMKRCPCRIDDVGGSSNDSSGCGEGRISYSTAVRMVFGS